MLKTREEVQDWCKKHLFYKGQSNPNTYSISKDSVQLLERSDNMIQFSYKEMPRIIGDIYELTFYNCYLEDLECLENLDVKRLQIENSNISSLTGMSACENFKIIRCELKNLVGISPEVNSFDIYQSDIKSLDTAGVKFGELKAISIIGCDLKTMDDIFELGVKYGITVRKNKIQSIPKNLRHKFVLNRELQSKLENNQLLDIQFLEDQIKGDALKLKQLIDLMKTQRYDISSFTKSNKEKFFDLLNKNYITMDQLDLNIWSK